MHNKSQFYLSQCIQAASKSPMSFTLGSIIIKGGKIISTRYNHQRTHYDEFTIATAFGRPVSMHAEMHAIFNLTDGRAPPFKQQVQPRKRKQQHLLWTTKKHGLGCAKPCWRCVDWCEWAGIKRIFYWSERDGAFCCIKVAEARTSLYETQADIRLFTKMVS
ncbi:hypothetical protein BDZ89DRAFT_1089924 [Hymenopellis radicata]|nr:hypothetical protein BDZ89DRAFT_1089924 [Hymenopellis radicata]